MTEDDWSAASFRFRVRGPDGQDVKVRIAAWPSPSSPRAPSGEQPALPKQEPPATNRVHLVLDGAEGSRYKLDVEGKLFEGTVGPGGLLERDVPKSTKPVTLTLSGEDGDQVYHLEFGDMPPITEPAGIQARLNALGYSAGSSGAMDEQTKAAIADFQEHHHLDSAHGLTDETRQLLERDYAAR